MKKLTAYVVLLLLTACVEWPADKCARMHCPEGLTPVLANTSVRCWCVLVAKDKP